MSKAAEIAALLSGVTITTDDNTAQLTLVSTDADGSTGPVLKLHRNTASPADTDLIGQILFHGEDDGSNDQEYVSIQTVARDITAGTEDGQIDVATLVAGTSRSRMVCNEVETVFNQDSVDVDFRVESDGNANMLLVDAGNNMVLIGGTDTSPFNNTASSATSIKEGELQVASVNGEAAYFNRSGSNGRVINIRRAGTFIGGIDVSTTQVTYNQTSDYRLKENVSYNWDATARLKKLKPARFNYIVDADNIFDGFLAHEVSEACPQAISGEKDAVDADGNIDPQCIDHSKLVPLLCKTILELEARITALENA